MPSANSNAGRIFKKNIEELKSRGVLIAIDDFGKGFNVCEETVLYLVPNILKIDKEVVQKPNENIEIWSSIKSIRRKINLSIIAEGVESSQDLDFVLSQGIQLCQGFYFGRPVGLREEGASFYSEY